MNKISAVLIVKNESAMLAKCLESIKGVDEIIICDTGSIDNTVEIAKKYTNNVQFFQWADDFALARNYAKSFAKHEWILSIDADEILNSENGIKRLKALINTFHNGEDTVNVTMDNGAGSKNFLVRLFKRELEWKAPIHETITGIKTITSDIVMLYGRSPAHEIDPDLDLRILKREHEKDTNNTRSAFYYGRELFYYKKFPEAIAVLESYLEKSIYLQEKTYAYYLIARCYWHNQQGELARDRCMHAIKMNPNFKAALYLMSDMYFEPNKSRWKSYADLADNTNCLFTS